MTGKLKITFVLGGPGGVSMGGYKVVYEYANHISRKGHKIVIVHAARGCSREAGPLAHLKNGIRYFQSVLDKRYRPDRWFQVDPNVKLLCVPSLSEKWVPKGDVILATAWGTAEWVSRYSTDKGKGFYLIQSLETWGGPEDRVYATWKAPLKKIVIANWLLDIAKGMGEQAVYIPNGLSKHEFQMDIAPEERDPKRVLALYHKDEVKGSADLLEALSMVRQKDPGIGVTLFGVPPRPAFLPAWIEYYQQPQCPLLRSLYNRAAIFVSPSRVEGWPLPPAEALLCGAALVATDIGGHREYAFHEKTALLSTAEDPQGLADNILRLLSDSTLRIRLATQGHAYIRQFTWERASERLESALCEQI